MNQPFAGGAVEARYGARAVLAARGRLLRWLGRGTQRRPLRAVSPRRRARLPHGLRCGGGIRDERSPGNANGWLRGTGMLGPATADVKARQRLVTLIACDS